MIARWAAGIRPRVVGAFVLVMAVVLAGVGVAVYSGVSDRLTDAAVDGLETRAAALARLIRERGGATPGIARGLDDPGETFSQVVGPGERLLANAPGLPDRPLLEADERADASEGVTIRLEGVVVEGDEGDEEVDDQALEDTEPEPFEDDRASVIARTVTVGGERLSLIVGATLEDREDALRALRRVMLVAFPFALLACALVGWLAVGAAIRPVERMRRRAEGITESSLADRLPLPGADDELRRLGLTLNAMLDRLEAAIARERGFVADASHELRTPLAVLRAELELALRRERSPEELREAIRSAHEEAGALGALAENLLTLAQADGAELPIDRAKIDARTLTERVARRFAPRAEALGRPLTVSADAGAVVRGDAVRLEQALGNLVENALRHAPDGPVELSARRVDGAVELAVADRGPGLEPELAARAFERFARGARARSREGAGLGLSIVQAIAEAHGGTTEIGARPGGGTVVIVRIPAAD